MHFPKFRNPFKKREKGETNDGLRFLSRNGSFLCPKCCFWYSRGVVVPDHAIDITLICNQMNDGQVCGCQIDLYFKNGEEVVGTRNFSNERE